MDKWTIEPPVFQESGMTRDSVLEQRLKELEAQLAFRSTAEEELRSFVENAPIGMEWLTPDGRIQWANRAQMDLLGYSPAEYIGRPFTQFHVDPEPMAQLLATLSDKPRSIRAEMRTRDGGLKTTLIDVSAVVKDGKPVCAQCFVRDITAQIKAERDALRLAAIVQSSDDAIVSKDLNGVIMSWNQGAERIFGYKEHEAIGRPVLMLIPEGRHNEEPEILRRIRAGEVVDHYETIRRRKDGTLLDISVTVSPIRDATGAIIGASKIARDITPQRRTQRELEAMAAELIRAKDELEQRVQERTASLRDAVIQMEEFSYTVSHDLRAPLRAMNMYSQVLLEEFAPAVAEHPDAAHYLDRIAANCRRLDRMIQDVLTFSRVARQGIVLQEVSLDGLVTDLITHYPSLQEPNAEVIIDPLGSVLGHEPSLVQAFSNLLVNAAKFVAPGVKPRIHLWADRDGDSVTISIQDNGIGIDENGQKRLFGMFERVHHDLDYEGSGVGLAIVRKAIGRMGGSVGVESDGESGSRFWIQLKAVKPEAPNE